MIYYELILWILGDDEIDTSTSLLLATKLVPLLLLWLLAIHVKGLRNSYLSYSTTTSIWIFFRGTNIFVIRIFTTFPRYEKRTKELVSTTTNTTTTPWWQQSTVSSPDFALWWKMTVFALVHPFLSKSALFCQNHLYSTATLLLILVVPILLLVDIYIYIYYIKE